MEFLESFARKYGGIVIAGVAGAIVRRLSQAMSWIEFFQVIFLGIFVSYCVGVVVEEYWEVSENFKYVIGAVSAVYSKEILDEIKDFISKIADGILKEVLAQIKQTFKVLRDRLIKK